MNHIQQKNELQKATNIIVASNDERFNFHFTNKPEQLESILEDASTPMMVPMNYYDYSIKVDDGDDKHLPNLCPLSLASCSNNLEDLEAFYASKYPRLPNEYHGILARYSSGQLLTKKDVKNTLKKTRKRNKELPVGLTIAKKEIELDFD